MKKIVCAAAACIALLGCSDQPSSKPYTGRFKIDAGTEYVALDIPSIIGGACTGWSAVEIRKPGQSSGAIQNIICWKREGDNITITSSDGKRRTTGPAALWTD